MMATKKQMHPFYIVFSFFLYIFCLSPVYAKPQPDFCRYGYYDSLLTHAMAESLKLYISQTPELHKKLEDEAFDAYQCFGQFHWSEFDEARSSIDTYCRCAHSEPKEINQEKPINLSQYYVKTCAALAEQEGKIKEYEEKWRITKAVSDSKPKPFDLNKFEWFCEDTEYFKPEISLESKDAHVDHLQGVLLTTAQFLANQNNLVLRGAGLHEYFRHKDVLDIAKKVAKDKAESKKTKDPINSFKITNDTVSIDAYFGRDLINDIKKAQTAGNNVYMYLDFISKDSKVNRNYIRITPINKNGEISEIEIYDRMLMSVMSVSIGEAGLKSLAGFYFNLTKALMTKNNIEGVVDTVKVKIFPYPADPDSHKHSHKHSDSGKHAHEEH